ncbi:MAG: hypothetical protein N4A33_07950 [Bacteriovoracaceae bacterium]|jgi:hypothetical protein|nr:hypothetical protein [Bacteriovoracaceae bacterium]
MKILLILTLLATVLTSCVGGFDYYYNPITTLENLKAYAHGQKSDRFSMLFERKAYCYYYNKKGQRFIQDKIKRYSDINIEGDLIPGKRFYNLVITSKGKDLAHIQIHCYEELIGNSKRKWCHIKELNFVDNNKKYPDIPVCESL